jgi:hypothetical protein
MFSILLEYKMSEHFDYGDPPDEAAWTLVRWLERHAESLLAPENGVPLTPDDRANLESAAEQLQPAFEEFIDAFVEPLRLQNPSKAVDAFALVSDMMKAAFAIGASGFVPESAEKIFKAGASKGGTISGKSRRENRPWVPHFEELAAKIYDEDKSLSDEKFATEISFQWRDPDVKCPASIKTLKGHLKEMRAAGTLGPKIPKPKEKKAPRTGSRK